MKRIMCALGLALALSLAANATFAQQAGQDQGNGKPKGQRVAVQLTADQRAQLQAKLKELRAANAKQEEISQAIVELYKGWGLEPPKGRALLLLQLTPDQRKQVREKTKDMRAANAKPEEIRAAITELLKGWGYELPKAGGEGKGKPFDERLTAEQRQQLQGKLKELKAANAKPEEIKAAIAELYKGWGLEPPKAQGAGVDERLTKDQRTELQAKIKELKDRGAKREEIKAAVAALYKQWGIEPPAPKTGHKDMLPGGLQSLLKNLTDEQRQQVLSQVDEMHKAGATPDAIKQKVIEMVKGFGGQA